MGFLHSLFGKEGIQKSSPSRCDARAFQHLTEKFPRVERSLKDLSQKNIILKEALRKFKGTKEGKKSRPSWIEVDASQLPASSPAKEC